MPEHLKLGTVLERIDADGPHRIEITAAPCPSEGRHYYTARYIRDGRHAPPLSPRLAAAMRIVDPLEGSAGPVTRAVTPSHSCTVVDPEGETIATGLPIEEAVWMLRKMRDGGSVYREHDGALMSVRASLFRLDGGEINWSKLAARPRLPIGRALPVADESGQLPLISTGMGEAAE